MLIKAVGVVLCQALPTKLRRRVWWWHGRPGARMLPIGTYSSDAAVLKQAAQPYQRPSSLTPSSCAVPLQALQLEGAAGGGALQPAGLLSGERLMFKVFSLVLT